MFNGFFIGNIDLFILHMLLSIRLLQFFKMRVWSWQSVECKNSIRTRFNEGFNLDEAKSSGSAGHYCESITRKVVPTKTFPERSNSGKPLIILSAKDATNNGLIAT